MRNLNSLEIEKSYEKTYEYIVILKYKKKIEYVSLCNWNDQ